MYNELKKGWNDFFGGSKPKQRLVVGLLAFIVALIVFQAGVSVGYRKASFSYRGGERFFRMIDGPSGVGVSRTLGFPADDLSPSHGAAGRIVSVSLPSFVVASPNNREETVVIGGDTVVRMFRGTASTSEIKPDRFAVVLGEPDDDGLINAKFVRIMPSPGATSSPF